jgi:type II secretory pathway component PulM
MVTDRSRWYRLGRIVGLWRAAVRDRGVVSGTGLFLVLGVVAIIVRLVVADVDHFGKQTVGDAD